MNLFEGNVVKEIGVSDHWGPMGPGNTFFRNVIQGEGIFLYDNSHAQNFVGNRSTKWNDDATSRNTLRHGEQINGVVIWDSSLTDHTISSSYYLNRKPVFYGAMEWPSVGVDKPNGTIPAWERWKSEVMVSGAREKKDVSNPKPKLILRKAADRHSFFIQINNANNRNPYLVVTDLSGKIAQTQLHHTSKEPDLFKLEFHNKQLGAGIFIIRLYADRTVVCQKLVIP
jgi:hypothetical protein